MKTVAILQPAYLPWTGFLERIACADEAILLDHVRIDRNSKTKFANRNRVRTAEGWTWLTVPLRTKGLGDDLALNSLEVDESSRWRAKHWATLRQGYARAPFFAAYSNTLRETLARPWSHLTPLCDVLIDDLLRAFSITTPLRRSSQMQSRSTKSALILDLCMEAGADRYLSGPLGRDYLDASAFARAGIELCFHDHVPLVYDQHDADFVPGLTAYDLLFHAGPSAARYLRRNLEARAA